MGVRVGQLQINMFTSRLTHEAEEAHLGEVPVLRRFGDGVGDVRAGRAEQHELVGAAVHHVEEGFDPDGGVALEMQRFGGCAGRERRNELGVASFKCHLVTVGLV